MSSGLPAMKIGVPSIGTVLIAVAIYILCSSVQGATLSKHHHGSAEEGKVRGSHLLRRDTQGLSERGETAKAHRVDDEMTKDVQREAKLDDFYSVPNRNFCNTAFPKGSPDSNGCTEPDSSIMTDWAMCGVAAKLHCPLANRSRTFECIGRPFRIRGHSDQKDHPAGCFIDSDGKFYYNLIDIANVSGSVTGTPVCAVNKYLNGTNGSMAECPSGYSSIDNPDDCRSAATCHSLCSHTDFVILENSTLEDSRPKGCHFAPDGCVQFNSKQGDPICESNCNGHPLCKFDVGSQAVGVSGVPAQNESLTQATLASE